MLFLRVTSCRSICYLQLNVTTVKKKKNKKKLALLLSVDSPLQQSFLHTKYIKLIQLTSMQSILTLSVVKRERCPWIGTRYQ